MNETTIRTIRYAILATTCFAVAVIIIFLRFTRGEKYQGKGRVMALEFIRDRAEIKEIVSSPEIRQKMRAAVLIDAVGIVPLYTILFLLLAWMLLFRQQFAGDLFGDRSAFALFVAAASLALVTAVGDSIENRPTGIAAPEKPRSRSRNAALRQILFRCRAGKSVLPIFNLRF